MNEIKVRDLPSDAIAKLEEQARKKHISRNEYLKRLLCNEAQSPESKNMDEKYGELVDKALEEIKECRKVIEENSKLLQEVKKRL